MRNKFVVSLPASVFLSCVVATLTFVSVAAEKPFNLNQEVDRRIREAYKTLKYKKTELVDTLEKMRAEEMFVTNAYCRAYIDKWAVDMCRCRGMWELAGWDVRLEQRIPGIARRDVEDPSVPYGLRVGLAALLSEYQAGENEYAQAEKTMRGILSGAAGQSPRDVALAHLALSDVFRWQDRFDEAWAEIEAAADFNAQEACKKARALAAVDGQKTRLATVLSRIPNAYDRIGSADEAMDYVICPTNPPALRAQAAMRWFGSDYSPQCRRAFAAVKGLALSEKPPVRVMNFFYQPLKFAYARSDWNLINAVYDTFRPMAFHNAYDHDRHPLDDINIQRMRAVALAATGKADAARKTIAGIADGDGVKPIEKAKFEILKALLDGADAAKVIDEGDFAQKDRAELAQEATSMALILLQNESAERLAAKFSSYYADWPQRTLKVAYSKDDILSVSDWRKILPALDRQFCDRKFGQNLEDLVTDVATRREKVETTERDSSDARIEVSSVCDTKGLHVFLRVEDKGAREVEAGFAGGIGTEMYFAPGKYEPYVCFSATPRTGVYYAFHTRYSCASHTRVDFEGRKDKTSFRSEVAFSDDDYVLHIFFAWDSFYRKLPVNGTKWRFECLAFAPKGALTLGGSESVHNSSKFCDLVFDLKPEEITAIRRALIFRSVKSWKADGRYDRFDKWNDVAVGDPEFYEEVLKPIEAELKGYEQMVKFDMSDTEVDIVFEKAIPRWLGIKHEIDALRRDWLAARQFK